MNPEEELLLLWEQARAFLKRAGEQPTAEETQLLNNIIRDQTNGLLNNVDDLATTAGVLRRNPNMGAAEKGRLLQRSVQRGRDVALRPEESPRGESFSSPSGFLGLIPRETNMQDAQQSALKLGQGAMLGGLDDLVGGINAATALIPGGRSPGEAFTESREQVMGELDDFQQRNPKLGTALEVGGGLASGFGAPAALGALKGASKLGTLGRISGVGAAEGGLAGALTAEPGERGQGAATGAAVGGVISPLIGAAALAPSAVRGLGNVGSSIKEMFRKIKTRPTATSVETSADGINTLASEINRADTPFNINTIKDDVERARKFSPDPDNFTLSDHAAFTELAEQADRKISTTSLEEMFGGRVGTGETSEAIAAAAPKVAVSPSFGGAGLLAKLSGGVGAQRRAQQFRAVSKWLSDKLGNPNPDVWRKVLDDMVASADVTTRRPPLGLLTGTGAAATQQLLQGARE